MRARNLLIVGAGIMGSSIAYHAARAGAKVTLVDAGRPGAGVTAGSFAWIGASGVRSAPAAALRLTATDEYHRLEAELPGLPVTWSGSLGWAAGDAPEAGPGQEIVDGSTVLKLEPNLLSPPEWAIWAAGDGAIDPVGVSQRLVAEARDLGARILLDTPVAALRRNTSGQVVGAETAAGFLEADTVVLSAGVASASMAASIGVDVPMGPSPATLFTFSAPPDLVRTVISNEDFDLRQAASDRLVSAADSPERTLAAVRSTFRGAENVELLSIRISDRPMPADGEPIIGPVEGAPGLYFAVMHAAVTLAAAVGRLAADALVHGKDQRLFTSCGVDRFRTVA